jgi:diguanylate cyclase (GGDEF)-like protein
MPHRTHRPTTTAIRTGLVRWYAVFALLWIAVTISTVWLSGPRLNLGYLIWLPLVAGFVALSGLGMRRILNQVERLDDENDDLRAAYDRVRVDALLDGLTGLGNHRAFQEELELRVTTVEADSASFVLMVLDVDDLKLVNEVEGHAAGDELLRATAKIITSALRRFDRGFRIGGDEFALVLRECDADEGVAIARRILASALSGGSGTLGVAPFSLTIGVSSMPGLARDRKQLVHQADAALYWGKRHGRTDVQLFDPRRHGIANDGRSADELAAAVSRVAADQLLTPVYQPIHCLRTGRVLGYEGLVRPQPDSGFDNASALFIAAESTGHTVELDLASLDTVLGGARALDPDLYLSVNLSPRSLESDAFKPHELLALARRRDIDPMRIVLELTEREAVEDIDRLRDSLAMLRRHGVRIAADDVGAGNAGLRLLRELDFDIMKIDLSLIQAGTRDDPSLAVVRALLELARRRGQMVVAEGVETPEQLVSVIELGLDAAQGYLLHRPGPALDAGPLDLARLAFPPDPMMDATRTAVATAG